MIHSHHATHPSCDYSVNPEQSLCSAPHYLGFQLSVMALFSVTLAIGGLKDMTNIETQQQ